MTTKRTEAPHWVVGRGEPPAWVEETRRINDHLTALWIAGDDGRFVMVNGEAITKGGKVLSRDAVAAMESAA